MLPKNTAIPGNITYASYATPPKPGNLSKIADPTWRTSLVRTILPANLFTTDVFCDFTMPRWRLQAQGLHDVIGLRLLGHPGPGTVPRWRCEATAAGLVMEVEERWNQEGKQWYCRELFWAKVREDSISELSAFCTGDWDQARETEHARAVTLLRP